jgi:hypothetical protein
MFYTRFSLTLILRKSPLLQYAVLSSDIESAFSRHAVVIVIYFIFVRFTACCMHTRTRARVHTHIMRKEIRILTRLHSCLPVLVLNLKRVPEGTCANYLTIDRLCSPPIQCVLHTSCSSKSI